jgi:hypothetical protein
VQDVSHFLAISFPASLDEAPAGSIQALVRGLPISTDFVLAFECALSSEYLFSAYAFASAAKPRGILSVAS